MRKILFAALSAVGAILTGVSMAEDADPFQWLEEVEGEKPLAWVRAQNERSLKALQADAHYEDLQTKALAILEAKDRIPVPGFRAGQVYNFWQDDVNVRGLVRRTSVNEYRKAAPQWDVVLDVDALSKAEGANWVYQGAGCLQPDETKCLVSLSEGGKDAVEIREFDNTAKTFVVGGFRLPAGKQNADWLDADTLYVSRDFGPGTMTESGYPFVVKKWARGSKWEDAVEVYRGKASDVAAGARVWRDENGRVQAVVFTRYPSFFETEYYLSTDGEPVRLPFPLKSSLQTLVSKQIVLTLEQDWAWGGASFVKGTLLSFDLEALKRDSATAKATVVYAPGGRESIEQVSSSRNRLLVTVYENVKGALYSFRFSKGTWTRSRLKLPANASISVVSARSEDDQVFVNVAGFLEPDGLYFGDVSKDNFQKVKSLPPRFDASSLAVDQFEVASTDGVKVPYFVLRKKGLKFDGGNPTLLYAYGGFQVSMTPSYSGTVGKLWLERGGVYVLANIRGGGEFGPAWHQAGLKTKRQIIYDDFVAVAQDLVTRKVTTSRRLGIMGGSNGGLLMGVALTQRPELWNAVVVQVPLLDMLRYHKLLAGASWMGEYGDPADPVEGAFLRKISPYHNLKEGVKYPEPFFVTSSKDDRVHPGHARKMAARMEVMKLPFLYYENIDGGHAAAANQRERAKRIALEFTYLSRKLMD
ncbi:MAG: prolyl oligopeptidase family serine peptidase [Alphaproteobacteria bacterium]|nr:prolyl oligopeptidase family serine peptidase [Alphaproteobacteria bacterium]